MLFVMNFCTGKGSDDWYMLTMVSLHVWPLYMQLPLDNRENEKLWNVCLSQICENIFLQKFLLTQWLMDLSWNDVNLDSCADRIKGKKIED